MTIGKLSRRTGVSVKTLREYEDLGLIYTVGRSAGNYRLFDDDALWCVEVVARMRGLGLTLTEIQELAGAYLKRSDDERVGARLAVALKAARSRIEDRIIELEATLSRISEFEAAKPEALAGREDLMPADPRRKSP